MARDPRFDILFDPIQIGPVTARNRFYQVPHCCGMGFNWPQTHAKMREMKAEGGWAVVCTEECMIHPSSDYTPEPQARLWDDQDVKILALMVDAVHAHGALGGAAPSLEHVQQDVQERGDVGGGHEAQGGIQERHLYANPFSTSLRSP